MYTKLNNCPHCGSVIENENLIVCTKCGKEIYMPPKAPKKKYNLFSAYGAMFAKMFDFKSRSTRSEYWYAYLANFIIMLIFTIALFTVDYAAGTDLDALGNVKQIYKTIFDITNYVSMVYSLVILVPQLSLIVRRLHDTNRSAFFALLAFATPVGSIFLMWLLTLRGTQGPNRYGDI